mmetsp:Transcript_107994/g.300281  ORF Transcript_107994/g.300281 Transcript_107994/m.300281 type:complete len:250 (+) Transcript_107994:528-1277(+)
MRLGVGGVAARRNWHRHLSGRGVAWRRRRGRARPAPGPRRAVRLLLGGRGQGGESGLRAPACGPGARPDGPPHRGHAQRPRRPLRRRAGGPRGCARGLGALRGPRGPDDRRHRPQRRAPGLSRALRRGPRRLGGGRRAPGAPRHRRLHGGREPRVGGALRHGAGVSGLGAWRGRRRPQGHRWRPRPAVHPGEAAACSARRRAQCDLCAPGVGHGQCREHAGAPGGRAVRRVVGQGGPPGARRGLRSGGH